MALSKRVKLGGVFYKGHKLVVSVAPGDYVLDMSETKQAVISGITVVPDAFGSGDTFKLEHTDASDAVKDVIAETIYNIGALTAWHFDFATLIPMEADDKLKLTYTNAAGIAINVYTSVEKIK